MGLREIWRKPERGLRFLMLQCRSGRQWIHSVPVHAAVQH
jgi:hypothetical protein